MNGDGIMLQLTIPTLTSIPNNTRAHMCVYARACKHVRVYHKPVSFYFLSAPFPTWARVRVLACARAFYTHDGDDKKRLFTLYESRGSTRDLTIVFFCDNSLRVF